jgi:hypothetical protein
LNQRIESFNCQINGTCGKSKLPTSCVVRVTLKSLSGLFPVLEIDVNETLDAGNLSLIDDLCALGRWESFVEKILQFMSAGALESLQITKQYGSWLTLRPCADLAQEVVKVFIQSFGPEVYTV